MASRPCKPDADLKRIWRTLLPGTPFPVCGTSTASDANSEHSPEPPAETPDNGAGETI